MIPAAMFGLWRSCARCTGMLTGHIGHDRHVIFAAAVGNYLNQLSALLNPALAGRPASALLLKGLSGEDLAVELTR